MRPLLILAVFCGLSSPVLGADPPALLITRAGHYFVVTDDNGEPVLVKITNVITIGDGPPVVTPPGDQPPTPTLTNQVREWAAEVNHPVGAQALALIYKTIGEKVADGSLQPSDAFPAIKQASDQVLPTVGGAEKWVGFRTKLGDVLTRMAQNGELTTSRHYSTTFKQIADGLEGATAEAPAMNPELVKTIIELILRLLVIFGVGAPPTSGPV